MYAKVIEWLKRYIPAEIAAICGALTGGLVAHYLFDNPIITALGGTWGENIGFYGQILFKDLQARRVRDEKITPAGVVKVLRNIVVEFGPGEYFDSFMIRPIAMYVFPQITGNMILGLFLGKVSADVTFYIPTIIMYEFRKKYLKD